MTSIARETLQKARFFLKQTEDQTERDHKAAATMLEAVVVFTRSVTFHLQKEFASSPGFKEWYEEVRKQLAADDFSQFMLTKRNFILKEGTLSTNRVFSFAADVVISISDFAEVTVKRGAPWYKRPMHIIWDDLTAPIRSAAGKYRRQRSMRKRAQTKRNSGTQRSADLFFAEKEWQSVPASTLIRNFHDRLERIVSDAEDRFQQ